MVQLATRYGDARRLIDQNRPQIGRLQTTHGFELGPRTDLRHVYNRLTEAAGQALDDIKDQIGAAARAA
jgi:hypothetical protein